jgi:hypothetical protein
MEIEWIAENNPSGVLDIQCAPYPLLNGDATVLKIGDLSLTAASPWLSIYFTAGTKVYNEKDIPSNMGSSYQVDVAGFFPGDSSVMRVRLDAMNRIRWVLRVKDNAGIRRQVGASTEPLQFIADFQNEGTMAGDRGYRLQWSGLVSKRPVVLT